MKPKNQFELTPMVFLRAGGMFFGLTIYSLSWLVCLFEKFFL